MAHEILSLKLCQLDDRMERLHSRVRMSETADHGQLQREMERLERECAETEAALREHLRRSKSDLVSVLDRGYRQAEQVVRRTRAELERAAGDDPDGERAGEEKILLAEYALDFAQQAADRALLLSLRAIDAQLVREDEKRRSEV